MPPRGLTWKQWIFYFVRMQVTTPPYAALFILCYIIMFTGYDWSYFYKWQWWIAMHVTSFIWSFFGIIIDTYILRDMGKVRKYDSKRNKSCKMWKYELS